MTHLPKYLTERSRLRTLEVQAPPSPWYKVATYAVGGLLGVGYGEATDLLLVISSQGRSVFDSYRGKMARNYAEPYLYFAEVNLTAQGIGVLADEIIHTASLDGGRLPRGRHDSWRLEALPIV